MLDGFVSATILGGGLARLLSCWLCNLIRVLGHKIAYGMEKAHCVHEERPVELIDLLRGDA